MSMDEQYEDAADAEALRDDEAAEFARVFMSDSRLLAAALRLPAEDERDGMLALIEGQRKSDPHMRDMALRKIDGARYFTSYVAEMVARIRRAATEEPTEDY